MTIHIEANEVDGQIGYYTDERLDEISSVRRSMYALHLRLDDIIDNIFELNRRLKNIENRLEEQTGDTDSYEE